MIQYIKYAYVEFKQKPFLVITFCALLTATFFGYKWVDIVKRSELEKDIYRESYQARLQIKDSVILKLTTALARAETLNELNTKIKKK